MRIKSRLLLGFGIVFLLATLLGLVAIYLISQEVYDAVTVIRIISWSLAFILTIILTVAWTLARFISRNIIRLKNDVDQISKGNFKTEIQVRSNDEIGDLTKAFMRIVSSMKLAVLRIGITKDEMGLGENEEFKKQ